MSENRGGLCGGSSGARNETVCIDTDRVLDSCRDRDCYRNARVYLTDFGYDVLGETNHVRVKESEIGWTSIGITPVPFNGGFYTVTIRFYIRLAFEACVGTGCPQEFCGIAILEKQVVLYGGESNVNVFRSQPSCTDFCATPVPCLQTNNLPTAVVETVDPIILDVKIAERPEECGCSCCCCSSEIPETVHSRMNGELNFDDQHDRFLTVSVGLFSVVRIVRPGQYLVQATEYCVPDKECVSSDAEDPCGIFQSMPFPTNEFNAGGCGGSVISGERSGRCGCGS